MSSVMRIILAGALAAAGTLGGAGIVSAQARLLCGGTEPFWNVTFTGDAMWFSSPDIERMPLAPIAARNATGVPVDQVRVYQSRRLSDNVPVTLVVTRSPQSCSDGMSDRRYPYDAVYIGPDRVLQGCCRWEQ